MMKQHITVGQLRELSSDNFVKLYRIIRPNGYQDWYRLNGIYESIKNGVGFGPNKLLSEIHSGMLIEFLSKRISKGHDLRIAYEEVIDIKSPGMIKRMMWCVSIVEYEETQDDLREHKTEWQRDELCDALWDGVKYVLKEENND